MEQIALGALQRTGDNILALTQGIATGNYLGNPLLQDHDGSLVFFDFLGAFVIRWPQFIATIINITSIFIGAYSIYLNMKVTRQGNLI